MNISDFTLCWLIEVIPEIFIIKLNVIIKNLINKNILFCHYCIIKQKDPVALRSFITSFINEVAAHSYTLKHTHTCTEGKIHPSKDNCEKQSLEKLKHNKRVLELTNTHIQTSTGV